MNGHVLEWLGAYLDGELGSLRSQKVESHLEECAICRSEFEGLRRVSGLVKSVSAPEFMPAEKFASQLALQLPRQTVEARTPKKSTIFWWLVPALLLAAWFFVQIVFTLSNAVSFLDTTSLLGGASQLFTSETGQSFWFAVVTDLFNSFLGGGQQAALSFADRLSVLGAETISQFLWQAVIALLYVAWLVIWWVRRGSRQSNMTGSGMRS